MLGVIEHADANMASSTTTFIVKLEKCMHYGETKLIGTYKGTWTLKEVFEEVHPEVGKLDILECRGHMGSGPGPGGSPVGEGVPIDWITCICINVTINLRLLFCSPARQTTFKQKTKTKQKK